MIYTINRCNRCGTLYLYPPDPVCSVMHSDGLSCGGTIAPAIVVMGETHDKFTPPSR